MDNALLGINGKTENFQNNEEYKVRGEAANGLHPDLMAEAMKAAADKYNSDHPNAPIDQATMKAVQDGPGSLKKEARDVAGNELTRDQFKELNNLYTHAFESRISDLALARVGGWDALKARAADQLWNCLLYTSPSPRDS